MANEPPERAEELVDVNVKFAGADGASGSQGLSREVEGDGSETCNVLGQTKGDE